MLKIITIAAMLIATPAIATDYVKQANADLARWQAEWNKKAEAKRVRCVNLGTPKIGMTGPEVTATCWGRPVHINETVTADGNRQQWVYSSAYVYLSGGIVTAIQTSR